MRQSRLAKRLTVSLVLVVGVLFLWWFCGFCVEFPSFGGTPFRPTCTGKWRGSVPQSLVRGGNVGYIFLNIPMKIRLGNVSFSPYFPSYIPAGCRLNSFDGVVLPRSSPALRDGLIVWEFTGAQPRPRTPPTWLQFKEGTEHDWIEFGRSKKSICVGQRVTIPNWETPGCLIPPEGGWTVSTLDWPMPDGVHTQIAATIGGSPYLSLDEVLRVASSMKQWKQGQ